MALTIDKSCNPIKITGTTDVLTEITNDTIRIQAILWSYVTTAGHKAMIKNRFGKEIAPLIADTPGTNGNLIYFLPFGDRGFGCQGLYCDDLDSGELYIYLSDSR